MKIGLLQCDDIPPPLQDRFVNYPEMFEQLLQTSPGFQAVELIHYPAHRGMLPESVDACDAYVTTGSRCSVTDNEPWIAPLEDFIRKLDAAEKKLIGVCFGHQLIVQALGGTVERSDKGWGIGAYQNRIIEPQTWMQPAREQINLLASHQDQVTAVSDSFTVLASSPHCPFYMIQHKAHFLGIQGHPEFSKAYSEALMNLRKDSIPAERFAEGIASLTTDVDTQLLQQWMLQFLTADSNV